MSKINPLIISIGAVILAILTTVMLVMFTPVGDVASDLRAFGTGTPKIELCLPGSPDDWRLGDECSWSDGEIAGGSCNVDVPAPSGGALAVCVLLIEADSV